MVQAFDDFVEDRDDSRAVTHLVTRLEPQYGERAHFAEAVLDRLAVAGPRSASDIGLRAPEIESVLTDLIDDHYPLKGDHGLGWRYEVLRVFWVARRRVS